MAAEGAKTENADLGTVANATTTIMTDYKSSNITAAQAVNTLIAVVKNGKTNLQDLSGAMATVLPIAATSKISLNDVAAAMATMTNAGTPAAMAATYLKDTIMALDKPTAAAVTEMKSMGLNSVQVATQMQTSLPTALSEITDAAGKKFPVGSAQYVQAVATMIGGTKSMQGILELTGANLSTFQGNVTKVSDAVKKGGSSIIGWSDVQNTFNFKLAQAQEVLETLAIKIGTALIPAAQALMGVLGGLMGVLTNVATFFMKNQVAMNILVGVVIVLGGAIGGLLVAALVACTMAAILFLAPFLEFAPIFIAVGAGVALLVAGIVLLYNNFAPLRAAVAAMGAAFMVLWNQIIAQLKPAWDQLTAAVQQAMPALRLFGEIIIGVVVVAIGIFLAVIEGLAVGIAAAISGIIQIIKGWVEFMTGVFNVLAGIVNFFIDLFTGHFNKLGGDLGQIMTGIGQMFLGAWNVIAGIFNAAAGLIGGIVVGFISGLINFFKGLFDALVGHSIIPDMINAIVAWFAKLPQMALSALAALPGMLANFWNGIINAAKTAGANIVNGIANGIRGAIGAVGSAISAVTSFITSHLPSSPAKIGPLVNLQKQGSMIPDQISQGILSGLPKLQSTMNKLPYPGSSSPAVLAGVAAASAAASSGGAGNNQPIALYIDGKEVTSRLGPHIANAIQVQGKRGR